MIDFKKIDGFNIFVLIASYVKVKWISNKIFPNIKKDFLNLTKFTKLTLLYFVFVNFTFIDFNIFNYLCWRKDVYVFSKKMYLESQKDLSEYESRYYMKIKE